MKNILKFVVLCAGWLIVPIVIAAFAVKFVAIGSVELGIIYLLTGVGVMVLWRNWTRPHRVA